MTDQPDPCFGPNVWLIEEMHARYLDNPQSVSEAWREFFEDYRPPRSHGPAPVTPVAPEPASVPLRGPDAVIARRMEESLEVPTATSVRVIPAKLLEVNRGILNNHLARTHEGRVSFTHLISYAVLKAVAAVPQMNATYLDSGGAPHIVQRKEVNLGLAVDVRRKDGSRTLLVPNIKDAASMDFASFHSAYETVIRKVDSGGLTPDDFAGTTVTVTNPGTLGTVQSVPRLMTEQAVIVGVGALGYPAEFAGADPRALAEMGVGKTITLSSTYDHRVIQGAASGEFLGEVERLLLGGDGFYQEVFRSMGVPYVPVDWRPDVNPEHDTDDAADKQARIFQLINIYRVRGHLIANLDPLEAEPPQMHPELDPATYGFTIWDLDRRFLCGGLGGHRKLELSKILAILRDAYCRTMAAEYMHISEPNQKSWIQNHVEGEGLGLEAEERRRVLSKLNEAEAFETFLHRKYVGHKRFSLQGAESLIPMLDAVLEGAAERHVEEVVIGMSHRGRLNVLTSILGWSYGQVFQEFEGNIDPETAQGSGDVKYHLGAAGVHHARNGRELQITLASNPSHLESVDPVVEGMARAKQDARDEGEAKVLPLLLHGDAAFAGQGVVAETLNLSQLEGYSTGGTIHIIVNNQLGFTTGADYGRSSTYASDVAKMVQAPIFHVNGDNPDACVRAARLAFEFRQTFRKDVVIDMWCYRRWGHNEADDPSFTQPLMYRRIESRRSVRKLYTEDLVNRGDMTVEEAEEALEEYRRRLKSAFDETRDASKPGERGKYLHRDAEDVPVKTSVSGQVLEDILESITATPAGFEVHPKLSKWLERRAAALSEDAVDWAAAEALAIGSLLQEGTTVRLAGQDTRRGTFSQRHSVLVDQETGEESVPLASIGPGTFYVYDSLLSEFAALGFEYGYSVANPPALVMWEAQFGDFANGGQVTIDQFIAAGEDKWGQPSSLVLLLPHGYDGQGPEHSSARLERFLQLAAEGNFRVVIPTTAANYFHLLRLQALSEVRRPLVVMTPKLLLRLPDARSTAGDLMAGEFRKVIPDPAPAAGPRSRVVLTSGQLHYELAMERERREERGPALVRIEQLYPFPSDELREVLEGYEGAEIVWVQEEPENMGAWRFVFLRCLEDLGVRLEGVSRRESASPATGSSSAHRWEQDRLIERAFADCD